VRALVLGGNGFVGTAIVSELSAAGVEVRIGSRRPGARNDGVERLRVDATDRRQVSEALRGVDVLINCVTGSSRSISDSASVIVDCMIASGCNRLIHMSSMAAFGDASGVVDDASALGTGGGWYAEAKRFAEQTIKELVPAGAVVHVLRPGCVHGPGSALWVERVGDWLVQRRLGDLGAAGDGWSNLVDVRDVARVVVAATMDPHAAGWVPVNIVAPDSPRWNVYLKDFALLLDAVPVARIGPRRLAFESRCAALPLRVWERLAPRLRVPLRYAPPAIPPSLIKLLSRQLRLLAPTADGLLGGKWTTYTDGLRQSVDWYRSIRCGGE
jgi:nucleoside-diphosphate-sugar epimerase